MVDSGLELGEENEGKLAEFGEKLKLSIFDFNLDFIPHMDEEEQVRRERWERERWGRGGGGECGEVGEVGGGGGRGGECGEVGEGEVERRERWGVWRGGRRGGRGGRRGRERWRGGGERGGECGEEGEVGSAERRGRGGGVCVDGRKLLGRTGFGDGVANKIVCAVYIFMEECIILM